VQNSIHSQSPRSPHLGSIQKQEVLSKMWSGDISANGLDINVIKSKNMQVNVNYVSQESTGRGGASGRAAIGILDAHDDLSPRYL
jgi:hypothetical protein